MRTLLRFFKSDIKNYENKLVEERLPIVNKAAIKKILGFTADPLLHCKLNSKGLTPFVTSISHLFLRSLEKQIPLLSRLKRLKIALTKNPALATSAFPQKH